MTRACKAPRLYALCRLPATLLLFVGSLLSPGCTDRTPVRVTNGVTRSPPGRGRTALGAGAGLEIAFGQVLETIFARDTTSVLELGEALFGEITDLA
jgi:hypothetical protein